MVASPHVATILLRKLERLGPLAEAECRAIADLPAIVRHLARGQDVVRDHERATHCCLILDGWACRYQLLHEGRRQIFSFHVPGDIPDLQGLHLPVTDYSICTLNSVTAAFLPHERLHELTATFPRIAAAIWRDVLVDAAVFRAWMTAMGRRSACEAVAHLFCELYIKLEATGLADKFNCRLPITQCEIGDALGLSNVHVNRVLSELRSRKLITLHGHMLQIHDWAALTSLCDFDPAYLHLARQATCAAVRIGQIH